MSLLDEFVVSDENRELCDLVIGVTQADTPVNMLVYGPHGAGKTALAQARGRERDLLSRKTVMFCHADEMMSFLELGDIGDSFLERAGSADIVLIDGFDRFFSAGDVGARLCALLIAERHRLGLSTIAFSSVKPDELPLHELEPAISGYSIWSMAPLDEEGRVKLAHVWHEKAHRSPAAPGAKATLTDETLRYIVCERAGDLDEARSIIDYLVGYVAAQANSAIDVDVARQLLDEGN